MTSSIASGSIAVRSTRALRITAPRSPAVTVDRAPRYLPTGVRIGLTMAARRRVPVMVLRSPDQARRRRRSSAGRLERRPPLVHRGGAPPNRRGGDLSAGNGGLDAWGDSTPTE